MKQIIIVLAAVWGLAVAGAPILKITPAASFNFGRYSANQEKEYTFTLTNSGDEILKIEKIRLTCGCSAADVKERELSPGASTELIARIRKESIAGPFSKGIFIHSNASNGSIQMVTLNGDSIPLVKVLPQDKLYVGTLTIGKEFKQDFILQSNEPVDLAAPEISGDIAPRVSLEKLPENKMKLIFRWTPEKEYPLFKSSVKLVVNSPKNWNPVEITLQGQVKGEK